MLPIQIKSNKPTVLSVMSKTACLHLRRRARGGTQVIPYLDTLIIILSLAIPGYWHVRREKLMVCLFAFTFDPFSSVENVWSSVNCQWPAFIHPPFWFSLLPQMASFNRCNIYCTIEKCNGRYYSKIPKFIYQLSFIDWDHFNKEMFQTNPIIRSVDPVAVIVTIFVFQMIYYNRACITYILV